MPLRAYAMDANMIRLIAMMLLGCTLLGGCGLGQTNKGGQPYLTPARKDRGLVIVLTGIEGRSNLNQSIADGLYAAKVPYAIEVRDWTSSWMPILNQEFSDRNKRKAREIARYIQNYRLMYPDRPVFLVGQSGGCAMAAWVAESLGDDQVDGIVMLASSLSPTYRLDRALEHSRHGIVNFYSSRDVLFLGFGTTVFRTMDGKFGTSAGMVGYQFPASRPPEYRRLYQIAWNEKMADSGNHGLHLTSGSERFTVNYIAPFMTSRKWDDGLIDRVVTGDVAVKSVPSTPVARF